MSRSYKPFCGPFAPMLTEFVEQKRAVGHQYLAGYWVLRKFDSFSIGATEFSTSSISQLFFLRRVMKDTFLTYTGPAVLNLRRMFLLRKK